MSYMANKIVANIYFDMNMKKRTYDETENFYVGKVRKIDVEGA